MPANPLAYASRWQFLKFLWLISFSSSPLFAQSDVGELRLKVTDPDGIARRRFAPMTLGIENRPAKSVPSRLTTKR